MCVGVHVTWMKKCRQWLFLGVAQCIFGFFFLHGLVSRSTGVAGLSQRYQQLDEPTGGARVMQILRWLGRVLLYGFRAPPKVEKWQLPSNCTAEHPCHVLVEVRSFIANEVFRCACFVLQPWSPCMYCAWQAQRYRNLL